MSIESDLNCPALPDAAGILAQKLARAEPRQTWQRLEQPVAVHTNLLACLASGEGVRVYWSERDESREAAGFGAAIRIAISDDDTIESSLSRMQEVLGQCPDARFYGGLAFASQQEQHWPGFGAGTLVLPRIELVRQAGRVTLACHLLFTGTEESQQQRDQLIEQLLSITEATRFPQRLPGGTIDREVPDWQGWKQQVGQVMEALEQDYLRKVVLSRKQVLDLDGTLCPWSMLVQWRELTPHTYQFAFWNEQDECFFGVSPERLFRRLGPQLESEALAGTAPRGQTPAHDRKLAAALLMDDKNFRENNLVMESLRESLEECCEQIEPPTDTTLIKLRSVQHLRQQVRASLKPGTDDAYLLRLLHPTPAVGGEPRAEALSLIHQLEPYRRGWYAGPFGCFGYDCAEFAVSIRSALLQGERLTLFSGAGLVPGSRADAEWAELNSKLRTAQSLLGITL